MWIPLKVSIITICLNSAATIEQTISSVFNQTYEDIEYIIIDGGSTDGTVDIIKKYESRIAYWISEPDRGLYDAMNKGIDRATGDVIGILNSDDWYALSAVEHVTSCFVQSNADIVHGNRVEVSENQVFFQLCVPNIEGKSMYKIFTYLHPTLFVKKEIYEKYGNFNCRYVVAADEDLMLRFYVKGVRFCYVPEVLTYFRLGGISGRLKWRSMRELHRIVSDILHDNSIENKEQCIEAENCRFADARNILVREFIDRRLLRKNFFQYKKVLWNEKKLIIFGTGYWGRQVYNWCIKQGLIVKYFVDNSEKRQKEKIDNIEIKHPQALIKKDKNDIIIIAIKDDREALEQQLEQMGFCYDQDYFFYAEVYQRIFRQYMLANFSFIFAAKKHEG